MELTDYLGKEVRDSASGLTGIAIQVTEFLSGVRQVGIQPKTSDGSTFPEAYAIDDNLVDVVGDGISNRIIPPNPADYEGFKLGDMVRCKVTKIKGIATHKATFMNGCVTFCVCGEVTEPGKSPSQEWINSRMLEPVDAPPVAAKPGRSGGPSMKAPRSC